MAWLQRWWVLVVVVGAVVSGVIVAVVLGNEKNSVAVYAAIVGTAGILLTAEKHLRDRWKEEREQQQKEDDKKEVLLPEVKIKNPKGTPTAIGVELFNANKPLVPIKKVQLVLKAGEQDKTFQMCYWKQIERQPVVGTKLGILARRTGTYVWQKDLEQWKRQEFHTDFNQEQVAEILAANPSDLYIVVASFTNPEVLRVTGDVIQAALKNAIAEAGKQ